MEHPLVEPTTSLVNRLLRVARLDGSVYTEVAADPSGIVQPLIVVGAATGLACAGSALDLMMSGGARLVPSALLGTAGQALGGWLAWCAVGYLLGVRLTGGVATAAAVGQSLAFAHAFGALLVLVVLPTPLPDVLVWAVLPLLLALSCTQALHRGCGLALQHAWVTSVFGLAAYFLVAFVLNGIGLAPPNG